MISFDSLTVRYGSVVALDGVSGHVADGEWLGLIGPTAPAGHSAQRHCPAADVQRRGDPPGQPANGLSRRGWPG